MDVYGIITEKIINLLEQGIVPWRRPWTGTGLPRNLPVSTRGKEMAGLLEGPGRWARGAGVASRPTCGLSTDTTD